MSNSQEKVAKKDLPPPLNINLIDSKSNLYIRQDFKDGKSPHKSTSKVSLQQMTPGKAQNEDLHLQDNEPKQVATQKSTSKISDRPKDLLQIDENSSRDMTIAEKNASRYDFFDPDAMQG